jgi:hypothetical protein
MRVCEQVKRLLSARKLRDGDGILHPSWLPQPTPGDVVTALWAMGFKPEYASSKKSPSPFRRYFDQKGKRTLVLEPWTFEHLGNLPAEAKTKPKRIRLYQAELSRRLDDSEVVVKEKTWWPNGPKVWLRLVREHEHWIWEATSIVLLDGLHPTPERDHHRTHLKSTTLDLMPSKRNGKSEVVVFRPRIA